MGVAITVADVSTLRVAIAGLYGFEGNLLAGWAAHLVHGTLFGIVFASVLSDPGLYRLSDWAWKTLLAGIVYGLVLAIVGAGFVMPIWLSTIGVFAQSAVPSLSVPMLAWHVVYGSVLATAYELLKRR